MPQPIPIPLDRIRFWIPKAAWLVKKVHEMNFRMGNEAEIERTLWEQSFGHEIPMSVVGRAVECAVTEMLGGMAEPTWVDDQPQGRHRYQDTVLPDGRSAEVKCFPVRSPRAWGIQQGYNSTRAGSEGRVKADLLIAAACMVNLSRAEIVGYALRDDPMERVAKLEYPAYPTRNLRDPAELFPRKAPETPTIEEPLFYKLQNVPAAVEAIYAGAHPGWIPRGER